LDNNCKEIFKKSKSIITPLIVTALSSINHLKILRL